MARVKRTGTRQRVRRALLLLSFILMPVTLYYFSPALILNAAAEGVVNGSLIVFVAMFLAAVVLGRLWCGWACPAGGLQECAALANDRLVPGGRWNWTKWAIWIPWIGLIAFLVLQEGGYHRIDPLYNLQGGVTMAIPPDPESPPWYMIYYIVVAVFLGLALLVGRRAGCHYICWMAPFMILGRRLGNSLRAPALRLSAQPDHCTDCRTCSRNCPMSLDVNGMVRSGNMDNSECVLCLSCVDGCPRKVIDFGFARSTPEHQPPHP